MEPIRLGGVSKVFGLLALLLVALWVAGPGCSSSSTSTCNGQERCACYPNGTCNSGLLCLSNVCVSPGGGGASGSGGIGVNGSGGSGGGATGAGGNATTGAGGNATGTGGNNGAGAGGSNGSGGSAGATNLIKNGDFAQGKLYWDLTYQAGEVAGQTYDAGEFCVLNLSSSLFLSFSLGYPPTPSDAFVIAPGASYTLSYRARFAAGVSGTVLLPQISAKIGHASAPYAELVTFTGDTVNVNGSYTTFTHQINSATGDTGAGLVFNGTLDYTTEICFDDVTLVKN